MPFMSSLTQGSFVNTQVLISQYHLVLKPNKLWGTVGYYGGTVGYTVATAGNWRYCGVLGGTGGSWE